MIGKYHTSITNEALGESFNGYAINYIGKGNIDSDELRDEITGVTDGYNLSAQHFNKTSLEECKKFLDSAQEVVIDDFIKAAKANSNEDEYYEQAFYDFGRLIHNIQDFYFYNSILRQPHLPKTYTNLFTGYSKQVTLKDRTIQSFKKSTYQRPH